MELLEELKERRDKLSVAIARMEYELEHPLPPINHEEVDRWVDEQMAQERRRMLPRYKELLRKVADGSATFDEATCELPHYKWAFRDCQIDS